MDKEVGFICIDVSFALSHSGTDETTKTNLEEVALVVLPKELHSGLFMVGA